MIDEGQIDIGLLDGLGVEFVEVQAYTTTLVSTQLSKLTPGDDADLNEENLRSLIEECALKAFLSAAALKPSGAASGEGLVVRLPAEDLSALMTQVVREGAVTLTLAVSDD